MSAAAQAPVAEAHALSDAEVVAAIEKGSHLKPSQIGLTLNDVQTAVFSGMACKTCGQSGYTVTIYTPEKWIEHLASDAKRELAPFGVADVTDDMRQSVLRVVAMPSQARYITGAGLAGSSSVHRVVLADKSKKDLIQPVSNEQGTVQGNSAFRSAEYTSALTTFAMSDVARIRGDDEGEFFVVVVGDHQNKYFKVKTRMFKSL